MSASINSLFLTANLFLDPKGGGVQWCSHDYLNSLRSAGFTCEIAGYDSDMDFLTRIKRKFVPKPFGYEFPRGFVNTIVERCNSNEVSWLFLNNIGALTIAPLVRRQLTRTKIAFLSHGLQITDHLNMIRLCPELLPSSQTTHDWVGRILLGEINQRQCVDTVFCISDEDVLFERWLGSKRIKFIPRSIRLNQLSRSPIKHRVGTVSTLDHGPNLDGIRQLAKSLEKYAEVKLRVVGRPEYIGRKLQESYRCIEYLGGLDDEELRREASTWCGFVNPVFCQARGASTKVATALGWQVPVLTSVQGARGYCWNDQVIPRCDTPPKLAKLAHDVSTSPEKWRETAACISSLAPTIEEAGKLMRDFILNPTDSEVQ